MGERGKMPHLRKDDGFRICLQATPARRIGQRAERDEQTNYGFGLKGFGGCGCFSKICPHTSEYGNVLIYSLKKPIRIVGQNSQNLQDPNVLIHSVHSVLFCQNRLEIEVLENLSNVTCV